MLIPAGKGKESRKSKESLYRGRQSFCKDPDSKNFRFYGIHIISVTYSSLCFFFNCLQCKNYSLLIDHRDLKKKKKKKAMVQIWSMDNS